MSNDVMDRKQWRKKCKLFRRLESNESGNDQSLGKYFLIHFCKRRFYTIEATAIRNLRSKQMLFIDS